MEPNSSPTPANYGIGARVALHPMTDRYVEIILGALDDARPQQPDVLEFTTGQVSTFVQGSEPDVIGWLCDLIAACAARCEGAHLGVVCMLSRGCPGETTCELPGGTPWSVHESVSLPKTGVQAVAEWSLYPLDDQHTEHMQPILEAIEQARASGLYAGSEHFATRLCGDVAEILGLVATTWMQTGALVQHVVTHLSLSINSPTAA